MPHQLSIKELILLPRVWRPERNACFFVQLLKYLLYESEKGLSVIGAWLDPGWGVYPVVKLIPSS